MCQPASLAFLVANPPCLIANAASHGPLAVQRQAGAKSCPNGACVCRSQSSSRKARVGFLMNLGRHAVHLSPPASPPLPPSVFPFAPCYASPLCFLSTCFTPLPPFLICFLPYCPILIPLFFCLSLHPFLPGQSPASLVSLTVDFLPFSFSSSFISTLSVSPESIYISVDIYTSSPFPITCSVLSVNPHLVSLPSSLLSAVQGKKNHYMCLQLPTPVMCYFYFSSGFISRLSLPSLSVLSSTSLVSFPSSPPPPFNFTQCIPHFLFLELPLPVTWKAQQGEITSRDTWE